MAIGIDPESPHVTVLVSALQRETCLDIRVVTVMGYLALLDGCIDAEYVDSSSDIQLLAERCLYTCGDYAFIRMLVGTGWLRIVDGRYVRGFAWDAARLKDER